jgi:hypothetical protein
VLHTYSRSALYNVELKAKRLELYDMIDCSMRAPMWQCILIANSQHTLDLVLMDTCLFAGARPGGGAGLVKPHLCCVICTGSSVMLLRDCDLELSATTHLTVLPSTMSFTTMSFAYGLACQSTAILQHHRHHKI